MHAEILSIGDEVTSGQLLDTNSQWLSLRLEELGIRVLYHTTVGDELAPMVEVFRRAIERSDIVVATGGLGPTADDLTRNALAEAVGRPLVMDAQAMEHIRSLFARRNRPMPEQNTLQAYFPEGSRVVHNPEGTAPGIDLETSRPGSGTCRFFALPGVPAEMRQMWAETLEAALRSLGAGSTRIRHRLIRCFGAGESQLEAMLPDLIRRGREPRVGITASQATITLRITAQGPTDEACLAAMEPTVELIHQHLGKLVYGEGDDQLQDVVVRLLAERSATLAVAEWGTAGLVTDWLGSVAEHPGVFLGGLVGATPSAIARVLGLTRYPQNSHQAMTSEKAEALARQMATVCRDRLAADFALAVGPFPPETPQKGPELNTVVLAVAGPEGLQTKVVPFAAHWAIRKTLIAKQALDLLRLVLQGQA